MLRKGEKSFTQAQQKNIVGKLKTLRTLCNSFEKDADIKKTAILHSLSSFRFNYPGLLLEYHQLLLFLCAYPQNKNILTLANRELLRLAAMGGEIFKGKNKLQQVQLTNTGIANTQLNVSFSFYFVKWLMEAFSKDVKLFSIDADDAATEQVLCACLPLIERDLVADKMLHSLQMIRRLKGVKQTELKFLVQLFNSAEMPIEAKDVLWDALKVFIAWRLNSEAPSLTKARSPARKIFFHKKPLLKIIDWRKVIEEPIQNNSKLKDEERQELIAVGRGVLSMFLRETDPVTYANEEEVTLLDMGRGIDVALYPMIPERRLPLESYIGYIAFKNSIPVAYGGGWVFLHRAKIGVNVFPAFRGGESALLFCRILSAYRHHYKVKKFIVEPYQIGKNNLEGLKSGAFWFYYRLGFVPENERVKALAKIEFKKISGNKNYRAPLSVMRQLANSGLQQNPVQDERYPDLDPLKISETVNRFIEVRFEGNRTRANAWAMAQLFSFTDVSDLLASEFGEIKALNDLSLAACVLNKLQELSEKDRHNLVRLFLLKGGKRERDFILFSQRHWKFLTISKQQ